MRGSLPCEYDVRKPLVCCRTFSRRTAHQRGRFSGFIRPEGPHRQMQDFERWARGELQRRTRKFCQAESAADFREGGGSRSICPSKLGLFCNKFLLARVVLSLCMGEDLLVVCFLWLGQLYLLPGKFPSRCVFKRCICWGTFRLELNQKTAERLFESASARGDGWLRRLRNEAWKK